MVDVDLEQFKHDSWLAAVATGVSYALLVGVIAVLMFGVPYVIFRFVLG
jgi:Flp pilus assembly pilin Flp